MRHPHPPAARRRPARGRLLFSVNASWNVVNFRAGLIRRLLEEGYEVTVAAPRDDFSPRIEAMGCRFVDLPMQPHGRSPLADLRLLARYVRLVRAERPCAFLGYTAKPNIYGSLAAGLCGVPAVNNIAGLGLVFNEHGLTNRILKRLYRGALRRSAHVFFQNADDMAMFAREGLVDAARAELLPGSGVDLERFGPTPVPDRDQGFTFLLVARLLWQKGIRELIDAARIVRARHPDARVAILGFIEEGKPAYVQDRDLSEWEREGLAVHLGAASDVRPHLARAHCVVLPSYYPEGTPRALLEAAAMGRPIITCDMPGCRDVVVEGGNGYLVPPRDADALAACMVRVADLSTDALAAMGRRSREIAERRFDERFVLDRYARVLERLGPRTGGDAGERA